MGQVKVSKNNHVFEIALSRADKRNAFHPQMIAELKEAFYQAHEDKDTRAVYLTGEGKSFCSGADLSWMQSMVNFSMEENITDSTELFSMFDMARKCTKPIVAYVHGHVMGGAIGLAAIADVVACEKDTVFAFSEVKLGISPAVISPFVLSKVNQSHARRWMLSGEKFNADEALTLGLVHFVGEEKYAKEFAQKQMDVFKQNGPEAVRATKLLLDRVPKMSWDESRIFTTKIIAERRVSSEGQQGLNGFLNKQTIEWKLK